MKYIGRKVQVGIGKETSRGTAVTSLYGVPKTNYDFQDKVEYIDNNSSIGHIADSLGGEVAKEFAEGNLEFIAGNETLGLILLNIFGSVSSAETVGGDAYEHSFSVNNSNSHTSLSINVKEDNGDFRFGLGMLESLKISVENNGFINITAALKSKKGVSSTETITYKSEKVFVSRFSKFYIAANLAGLDAATAINIKKFEVTFTKNLEEDLTIGSSDVIDFLNKQFSIAGSVELLYNNNDYKDIYENGTNKSLRLENIDTSTIIGISDNPTFSLDISKVQFTNRVKNQGNDDLISETLDFKGYLNQEDGSYVTSKLINETTSY